MQKKSRNLVLLGILGLCCTGWLVKKGIDRYEKPYVTLMGPICMADGIGRQVAELAQVLMADHKVNIIPNHCNRKDVPKEVLALVAKKNKKLGNIIIVEETLSWATEDASKNFRSVAQEDQIRIAYSMLESTRIPQEWVMQLNLYYDAVAVPDPFLVDAYKDSGVTIPVFIIPLGLDLSPFLDAPLKNKRNPTMVFCNLSSALDRKNQVTLIKAFAKALGNAPDAMLQINARGGDKETKAAIIQAVCDTGCSNIHFSEIPLRKDAYLKLFQGVDCYVSLSKGEGFSIQPREAMALGIPVIATNNTGQTTICNSNLVKSIPSLFPEPAFYQHSQAPSGYRFNCDVDEVALAIKDVYEHYEDYLQNGPQARQWARFYNYGDGQLQKLYKSLVSPKQVLLGQVNEIHEEYIITDSLSLYEKYLRLSQPPRK